ncbi:MAG TPA: Slp family lipoprotein [Nitrospira sp.]
MGRWLIVIIVFPSLFSACSPHIFPAKALEGVDPNFDFSQWRRMPNQSESRKIQLGGRILQTETVGDIVTIVALQLPIAEHPAYGPKTLGKRSGEFAIVYPGKVDSLFLQSGNRLIVIGHIRSRVRVEVDDLLRSLPTVTAQCIHFWNTGDRDISDFSASGAGYETLREETYCIAVP